MHPKPVALKVLDIVAVIALGVAAYLALVYAAAIFGGYVADRVLGYQRSILTGAVIMADGGMTS